MAVRGGRSARLLKQAAPPHPLPWPPANDPLQLIGRFLTHPSPLHHRDFMRPAASVVSGPLPHLLAFAEVTGPQLGPVYPKPFPIAGRDPVKRLPPGPQGPAFVSLLERYLRHPIPPRSFGHRPLLRNGPAGPRLSYVKPTWER